MLILPGGDDLEAALEQQRGLATSAPLAPDHTALERDARTYGDRNGKIAALMARMGYKPTHKVAEKLLALEQQGAQVFALARTQRPEQASAAAARGRSPPTRA